jgi:transposase
MNGLQLPSEKELRAAYREGEEAVISLFQATVLLLAERIRKLEDQLAKNSQNSGKPPSSDGYAQPAPRSLRKRSRRKSGGQVGHRGETLKAVEKPDHVKVHRVEVCQHCHHSLKRRKAVGYDKRQVFDVPPVKIEVTEHRAEIKDCPRCSKETRAAFPREVSQAVQYGTEIKSQMVYLNNEQYTPLERTCDLLEEFYGHRPSEGTILSACTEAVQKVASSNAAVKEHLIEHEAVAHFDETSMMVNGVLNWLHSSSTSLLTVYAMHANRPAWHPRHKNGQMRPLTPAQVQRSALAYLLQSGTPARNTRSAGKGYGRQKGYRPASRTCYAVVFKTKRC